MKQPFGRRRRRTMAPGMRLDLSQTPGALPVVGWMQIIARTGISRAPRTRQALAERIRDHENIVQSAARSI